MPGRSDRRKFKAAADPVMIGEIIKPHGVRGELKVYPYSEQPENFRQYKKIILLEPAGSGTETYNVVKSREQGKLAILQLEGVRTREAAEVLQGSAIGLRKADFPEPAAGEYYWHELAGLQVFTESGRELGKVDSLFATGAHDMLVVSRGKQEYFIPVNDEIIKEIDRQAGRVIVTPPPGLLEANVEDSSAGG